MHRKIKQYDSPRGCLRFVTALAAVLAPTALHARSDVGSAGSAAIIECATLSSPPLAAGYLACHQSPSGTVLAPADEIETVVASLRAAAAAYETHFADIPAPILVTIGGSAKESISKSAPRHDQLVFHWPSQEESRRRIEAAVRMQVTSTLAAMTESEREKIIQDLLAKVVGDANAPSDAARGMLQHELGHVWFIRHIDGVRKQSDLTPSAPAYGSSAPDWLDEIAALLSEPGGVAETRRKDLKKAISEKTLVPLQQFLRAPHPHWGERLRGASQFSGVTVRVRATPVGEGKSSGFSAYYAQARGFADFLMQTSGEPRVFDRIRIHLAGGRKFDAWLASQGPRLELASDLDGLADQWEAWLAEGEPAQLNKFKAAARKLETD